jgi:hypothetical protein
MARRPPVIAACISAETVHRLELLLASFGVQLEELAVDQPDEEILRQIDRTGPSLLVLGVETDDRRGFALVSRVRRARGGLLPILLVTNSLSARELGLHIKQRCHADETINLREDDDASIIAALRRLKAIPNRAPRRIPRDQPVALGAPPGEDSPHPVTARTPTSTSDELHYSSSGDRESLDWVEHLLSAVADRRPGASPYSVEATGGERPATSHEKTGEAPNIMTVALTTQLSDREREITRLRTELERTKRYLTTSPFAGEFESLRAVEEDLSLQIDELKTELAASRHDVADREAKLYRLAELLNDSRALVESKEARLREVEARLEQRMKLAEAQRASLISEWEGRIRQVRESGQQTLEQLESEAQRVKESCAAAIDRAREEKNIELATLRTQLEAEQAVSFARHDRQWQRQLGECQAAHEGELEQIRREHETIIDAQQAAADLRFVELEEKLQQQRTNSSEALRKANQSHERSLHEIGARHETELDQLRECHAAEQRELRKSLEYEREQRNRDASEWKSRTDALEARFIEDLRASEAERLRDIVELEKRLEREGQETLQSAASNAHRRLEEARQEHHAALVALREEHARSLAELETRHGEAMVSLDRERVAELESLQQLRLADLQAAEAATANLVERMQRGHQVSLEERREEHEREIDLLNAQLAQAQAAYARAIEKIAALQREAEARLDQMRTSAEDARQQALDDLRQELDAERLRAVSDVEAQSRSRLEAAESEHRAALADMVEAHSEELARLASSQSAAQQALREEHARQLETEKQTRQDALQAAASRLDSELVRARTDRDQAVATLQRRCDTALRRLERDLENERALHEQSRQMASAALAECEMEHQVVLERLQATQRDVHDEDVATWQGKLASLEIEHRKQLEAVRLELSQQNEIALASGRAEFEREREAMLADHEAETDRLEKESIAALATLDEMRRAEVQRIDQALEDARAEYELEIATLEQTYREHIADLQRSV